jgi:hypothetical protein
MSREHQPRIELERGRIRNKAFEAILAIDTLLGADEAEFQVTEGDTVIGVPAAQHRARDFAGHGADRNSLPDPARR